MHVFLPTCTSLSLYQLELELFLNAYGKVMNSHSLCNGLLGDYCDGELYSQHPLFREDPCALQIQLYFDELELCNPLGSKTHKLGKTFFS